MEIFQKQNFIGEIKKYITLIQVVKKKQEKNQMIDIVLFLITQAEFTQLNSHISFFYTFSRVLL